VQGPFGHIDIAGRFGFEVGWSSRHPGRVTGVPELVRADHWTSVRSRPVGIDAEPTLGVEMAKSVGPTEGGADVTRRRAGG